MQFCSDGRRCAIETGSAVKVYEFERPTGYREMVENSLNQMHRECFRRMEN